MDGSKLRILPPARAEFVPEYVDCARHGEYQANTRDEHGVVRWLPCCPQCAASVANERAAIPARFKARKLDNYQAQTAGQKRALAVATEYAERFGEVKKAGRCLVFVGLPGTGKTHLACGIANHIMERGYSALFCTASELIRAVRATWRKGTTARTEEEVLTSLTAVDLLIVDEVGVQYGTEAEQITLFEVINRRYAEMRPIVLVSNLPAHSDDGQKTLQDYLGARAYDRLREGGGRLVVFDWPSHRGA